jgi:DNA-binding response OmpR family regulator
MKTGMGLVFGEFEIDPERRELRRDGREIALQPLTFDLLLHFARRVCR